MRSLLWNSAFLFAVSFLQTFYEFDFEFLFLQWSLLFFLHFSQFLQFSQFSYIFSWFFIVVLVFSWFCLDFYNLLFFINVYETINVLLLVFRDVGELLIALVSRGEDNGCGKMVIVGFKCNFKLNLSIVEKNLKNTMQSQPTTFTSLLPQNLLFYLCKYFMLIFDENKNVSVETSILHKFNQNSFSLNCRKHIVT